MTKNNKMENNIVIDRRHFDLSKTSECTPEM